MFESWRRQRARQELVRVSSTIHVSPLDEALAELDAIDTSKLSPFEVALWLNNRAYVLALLGRAAEALDSLNDADALLLGADDTTPVTAETLRACVVGTRGIALLHAGELDDAETHLVDALGRGEVNLGSSNRGVVWQEQCLAAERLWWLAEIAERRGDHVRRLELLRRAASFDRTIYGDRAREALVS